MGVKSNRIMNTLIDDLKKSSTLQGEELDNFLYEVNAKYTTPEDRKVITDYFMEQADEIEKEIDELNANLTIRVQLKKSIDILPMSYIAKQYFGKSASWLYQRINGNKVRGKVYTLNENEVNIFNRALIDISKQIGSLSVNPIG